MNLSKTEAAIEAVLFAMGNAVEVDKLAAAIGHDVDTTRKIVHNMMDKYEDENRGIQIIELENSYQMCTKTNYYDQLIKVASTPTKYVLTDALLENLSIIAYKQPITRMEIEKIRGVGCGHAISQGAGQAGCTWQTCIIWHDTRIFKSIWRTFYRGTSCD